MSSKRELQKGGPQPHAAHEAAAHQETLSQAKAPRRGMFGRALDRAEHMGWRRKLFLTLVLALTVTITFLIFRDRIRDLQDWGYLGAFLINMVSSATIILPAPGALIIALMGEDFNPLLIGAAAGVGGAIGGSSAYGLGRLNSQSIQGRGFRWVRWLMRHAGGIIIFISAMVPFFFGDIASLMAGGFRYPFFRYFLVSMVANVIKMCAITYFWVNYRGEAQEMAQQWLLAAINSLWALGGR